MISIRYLYNECSDIWSQHKYLKGNEIRGATDFINRRSGNNGPSDVFISCFFILFSTEDRTKSFGSVSTT